MSLRGIGVRCPDLAAGHTPDLGLTTTPGQTPGLDCSDGEWFPVGDGKSGGQGAGHDGPTGDGGW